MPEAGGRKRRRGEVFPEMPQEGCQKRDKYVSKWTTLNLEVVGGANAVTEEDEHPAVR